MRLMRVYQIGVLLCGLLCPVVALSQVFSVTPSITVGERYDNNVFQSEDNEKDDFITVVTPGIALRYVPSRDTELNFDYQPSWEFYADETDENNLSHRLGLSLKAALSRRLQLTLSDDLRITDEPGDRIREVILEDGTRDSSDEGRERTISNTAAGSLRLLLASRSSIGLLFKNRVEYVDDPDEVDEVLYTVGSEFAYLTHIQRGNRVLLGFTTDFFYRDINADPNADPNAMPEEADDFLVHYASVGYEHHFSPTLTTTARVGYYFTSGLDREDGDQERRPGGSIDLTKLLRTGSASIGFENRFTSGGGDGGEVVANRVVTQITTNLSPKIMASLGANATRLDFQGQVDEGDDRWFFTIRPKLSYQALRTLRLSAFYIFAMSKFDEATDPNRTQPDRRDHRFGAESRLTLRKGLSVALKYEYRTRSFENVSMNSREDDEFTRHRVFLSVTYGPTFR
ncbi:MAG: outer membrane beta-barrel protein, partial [Candidatus Tectomicrobia bacterium]|nr:outer membrane beta-barrel protein [Candidatus Tectomicrobia bacterium]